ncbi:MAG: AAA family ATPase [Rhodocyclales bacterium]|nr:AAA family ATPase [Rhodocyclales bacterium]
MKAIEAVRAFLASNYHALYPEFDRLADGYSAQSPGWLWVDDDLSPTSETSPHGLLLDPDVGIALFLLRFVPRGKESEGTDVRAQVAQAIAYRSRLLPQRLAESDADPNGSWRVMIHWLVDEVDGSDWQEQVSALRRDTAYMEELPVDAVVRKSKDWTSSVQRHDLPRLLLRTRKVLGMKSTDTVFQWSSADARVRGAMKGFAEQFSDAMEHRLARQVEARLERAKPDQDIEPNRVPAEPKRLRELSVRDFRNIQEVGLNFSGDVAQAAVIHGPNGTGKSNLFEALEFALRGTSQRAQDFLGDPDIATTKKEREYLERYLAPFGQDGTRPRIDLNGEEISLSIDRLGTPRLSGNLLSQEDTDKFINKKASDLAAEILGEFSGLADDLREHAEGELTQAQGNLKNMLTRLGLDRPGAVTKQETARGKVAEIQLRDVVSTPAHLLAMLQKETWAWSPRTAQATRIATEMQSGSQGLGDFSAGLGKLTSADESAIRLRAFLMPVRQARQAADQFLAEVAQIRTEWPADIVSKVDIWGRWLTERQVVPASTDNQNISAKQLQRKQHADELEKLTRQGLLYRERERHFETLQQFLRGPWRDSGEQRCPTCDTDFSDRGGILAAVEVVRTANNEMVAMLRKQYTEIQSKMTALDKELQVSDQTRCPLSVVDQAAVRLALTPHLPVGIGFDDMLVKPEERSRCLAWMDMVGHLPAPPQFGYGENEEEQITAIVGHLQSAYKDMEAGFQLPDAWKKVTGKLKDRLATVLDEHLPQTLGGLWRELVMNLTPARWQILGGLEMQVESRRGKQEARLVLDVEGELRLARYVLNKAETLSLGLAWFLVRYISQGRFRHSVLALDDPALDMDQTTFRDLCRLMESLLRLHKTRSLQRPLSLLIFLHQDERALDAARATGGLLHRLVWNTGQARLEKSMKLFSGEHRHPLPDSVFANEPASSTHSS